MRASGGLVFGAGKKSGTSISRQLLKNSLAYFRECMCSVVNATCKQNIFSEHDFKRGPISADNVKASLDRLEAKNAMECLVKDGPGAFLDTIDGPITNGKYFDCSIDLLWSCNPSLSTSQYFRTAIALNDLAYDVSKTGKSWRDPSRQ